MMMVVVMVTVVLVVMLQHGVTVGWCQCTAAQCASVFVFLVAMRTIQEAEGVYPFKDCSLK